MRILILVVYYPPSTTSAAQMMQDLALEYVQQGHQVCVVTPSEDVEGNLRITVESGITVLRVKTGNLQNANKVIRLWRESRVSEIIWRSTRGYFEANPCELIIFYSPTIFFGELVQRLKCMWDCSTYLILRDIFPKWAVDAGILRKGILYRYLKSKEVVQYAAADVIGVEASGNLSYFSEELPSDNYRIEVLYNWLDAHRPQPLATGWRTRLGLVGKIILFYGGNIGLAQGMDNILRLAVSLRDYDSIFFLLIGGGSEVCRLNREIKRLELRNIRILPSIPQNEYMECLSECDVGLVSLDRRMKSHNFPGKILSYISCGKPILASLNTGNELIEFLRSTDSGIACVSGEDDELRKATLQLAAHPEMRARMGDNARSLGEARLSVQVIAKQILSHFGIARSRSGVI